MSWLTEKEIKSLGFAFVGRGVLLSDKSSYYNCSQISIDDDTRIDDFCVLSAGSGGIHIGKNVHIAVYCSLIGHGQITLHDFAGLSSRVSIYSSNDDYSGHFMTNPTIPSEFTNVSHGNVLIKRHVIIGSGTIILPDVTLEDGVAIGALSVVRKNCQPFTTYAGNPLKRIGERSPNLLEVEKKFINYKKQIIY